MILGGNWQATNTAGNSIISRGSTRLVLSHVLQGAARHISFVPPCHVGIYVSQTSNGRRSTGTQYQTHTRKKPTERSNILSASATRSTTLQHKQHWLEHRHSTHTHHSKSMTIRYSYGLVGASKALLVLLFPRMSFSVGAFMNDHAELILDFDIAPPASFKTSPPSSLGLFTPDSPTSCCCCWEEEDKEIDEGIDEDIVAAGEGFPPLL